MLVPAARCRSSGRGGSRARCPRAARHSPMRLKLSDKVLRNFFILPIFSAGCGSMRSHIWATQSRGNFPKLVQSGAQTTAGARGAGKAAPPPPPSPRRAGRRRAGLGRRAASDGRRAQLRPGPRLGGRGRSRWCRGRPRSPPPAWLRAAPPPPGSFSLLCNRELRSRQWGRRGWRRGGGGPGTRCGSRGSPWARGAGGEKFSAASFGRSGEKASARNPRRRRRRHPAAPLAMAPGRGTPARPRLPARSPRPLRASPPRWRPRGAPFRPPPRSSLRPAAPPARSGTRARGGREPTALGAGRDWRPGFGRWRGHRKERG